MRNKSWGLVKFTIRMNVTANLQMCESYEIPNRRVSTIRITLRPVHTLPQAAGHICGRVHTSTQNASEIAGNSNAPLVEIQGKLKYAQLSAACGKV